MCFVNKLWSVLWYSRGCLHYEIVGKGAQTYIKRIKRIGQDRGESILIYARKIYKGAIYLMGVDGKVRKRRKRLAILHMVFMLLPWRKHTIKCIEK